MGGMLKGLFGGGEEKDRDFVNRVTTGDPSEGYSAAEAQKNLRKVMKKATPEQIQRATQKAIANLPENRRAEFNQMLQNRQAGTGGVQIQRSGSGSTGTGGATGADPNAMPGLDDLLGGLMGGGGGGGLGGILGNLFGGGGSKTTTQSPGATQGGDMFGSLGDLMSSPAGKAVIGGIAAFAMQEILDNKR